MLERVIAIISDHECIGKENLGSDTYLLQDLNINSFDLIDLICAFEEEFGIEIEEEQVRQFVTIGDIVRYLEGLQ